MLLLKGVDKSDRLTLAASALEDGARRRLNGTAAESACTPARTVKLAEKQRKRERIRARQTHIEQRVLRDQRCTLRAAHYARAARTLLHLLAIPSRLCLTWLRLSLKISNASSAMRGGGGDACVDGNRRDSGGMLHAC